MILKLGWSASAVCELKTWGGGGVSKWPVSLQRFASDSASHTQWANRGHFSPAAKIAAL